MTLVTCPDCGALAEITERLVMESTDGPIEHVRLRCVRWHWFLMPSEMLARHSPVTTSPRATRQVRPAVRRAG